MGPHTFISPAIHGVDSISSKYRNEQSIKVFWRLLVIGSRYGRSNWIALTFEEYVISGTREVVFKNGLHGKVSVGTFIQ